MTDLTHPPVERWDRFELALNGPRHGNPFLDVQFGALFTHKHREIAVDGFYDGEGTYRVRFMPDTPGEWPPGCARGKSAPCFRPRRQSQVRKAFRTTRRSATGRKAPWKSPRSASNSW